MAGWFDFVNGQTLPASRVQDFLMDQTVMVFANASARTTALTGIVSEGMVSYLLSTKNLWVYNGTAWVLVNPPEPPIVFPDIVSPLLLMGA
jgi:hypothetical protein